MTHRKQLTVFFILLAVYVLCAFLTYTFFSGQLAAAAGVPVPETGLPPFVFGLANGGIVLVVYGVLGLSGYWFAGRLGLPGIYSPDGNWRRWFLIPQGLGIVCGIYVVLGDLFFAPINGFGRLVHPGFPLSMIASLSAGIGEETLFRVFVFGLWAFLLNWLFKRFHGQTLALWIANVLAALAFAASHLGTILILARVTSIAALSPVLVIEIFLLNGVIGLIAGERYMKDGLVAAAGVHFWADVVFHVLYGLL